MPQHIAPVYQDQMRVEHDRRTDNGWDTESLVTIDAVLRFDSIAFEIGLAEIYASVDL